MANIKIKIFSYWVWINPNKRNNWNLHRFFISK